MANIKDLNNFLAKNSATKEIKPATPNPKRKSILTGKGTIFLGALALFSLVLNLIIGASLYSLNQQKTASASPAIPVYTVTKNNLNVNFTVLPSIGCPVSSTTSSSSLPPLPPLPSIPGMNANSSSVSLSSPLYGCDPVGPGISWSGSYSGSECVTNSNLKTEGAKIILTVNLTTCPSGPQLKAIVGNVSNYAFKNGDTFDVITNKDNSGTNCINPPPSQNCIVVGQTGAIPPSCIYQCGNSSSSNSSLSFPVLCKDGVGPGCLPTLSSSSSSSQNSSQSSSTSNNPGNSAFNIDEENISFAPERGQSVAKKAQDLKIKVSNLNSQVNGTVCNFSFKPYPTKANSNPQYETLGQATISNGTAEISIQKDKQLNSVILIDITCNGSSTNAIKYRANTTYNFRVGAFSQVEAFGQGL